jgi:putative ABC transport system permease protein
MIGRSGNFRMALESLRSNKWRSLLTMLGIVIGIVSVITTVSIGEGAKRSIVQQVNQAGTDIITVRPGERVSASNLQLSSGIASSYPGALSEQDYDVMSRAEGVRYAVPFSFVTNSASRDGKSFDTGMVIGVTESLPNALGKQLLYGTFFGDDEPQRNAAIIGQRVAEQLFGENVPIGKSMTIRGKMFIVRGIFEEFDPNPLAPEADYNSAIFIPYEVSKELTGESDIYQVLLKSSSRDRTEAAATNIENALRGAHNGQLDFSVQTQKDKLQSSSSVLTLMTGFVAGIAAISLIVGGIGILNIMLVSVTERTHEIGIRKAVGATSRQIMSQFLTEAVILSVVGGIVGILGALLANYLLRIFTELAPVMTWPIVVLAFIVSVVVGVIFGVTPALTAARKRPIDALRYE